jgi:hypothetical protein
MACTNVDDGSCEYEVDCAGVCGGSAEVDDCGECGGDGSSCGGENAPNWEDDPGGYTFTATIVGGIVLSDGEPLAESGDIFAAFDDVCNVRGVAVPLTPPFGPYEGEIIYEMTIRSNDPSELISFKYYDASEDIVLDIVETYEFVTNEQVGDMIAPEFYTILIVLPRT